MERRRWARWVSRRRLIGGLALGATALIAACSAPAAPTAGPAGSSTQPDPTRAVAPTATPPAKAAEQTAPTAAARPAEKTPLAGSRGELRIATAIGFPATLDVTQGFGGWNLVQFGAAETLMRLTPEGKLVPWLAEGIANIDPLTWKVTLRGDVRFWDGAPMTAQSVIESYQRCWEKIPTADRFISKATQLTVLDARTIQLKTPAPAGDLPNNLATWSFVIHRPGADGSSILTGPYRHTRFIKDQEMTLEANPNHWGGPPPLQRLQVKLVPDANTRLLALQSGDVDLVYGVPPEMLKTLGAAIEGLSRASTRLHYILFNHARPPFNDRAVRAATSQAIDRQALNTLTLDGQGTPTTGMYPPGAGLEVLEGPTAAPAAAQQQLEEAGWKLGPDGVRAKGSDRLAFTLYSYPGRAELTQMAVAIQAQLKPLGYEIKVQEVRDIAAQLKDGNFEASMYSVGTLVNGDPLYMFATGLLKGAPSNLGAYINPELERLAQTLRDEADPARRLVIAQQGQAIVQRDAVNAFLMAAPIAAALRKEKVRGFVLHPNDLYLVDRALSVVG